MGMKLTVCWLIMCMMAVKVAVAATVGDLHCESRHNPLGIDELRPQLSWIIKSDRRSEVQTAYQILVASTPELLAADQGDLWDSGKIASDATAQVEYAGQKLSSFAQCFWKVRVWDRAGQPSAWSPPASWS